MVSSIDQNFLLQFFGSQIWYPAVAVCSKLVPDLVLYNSYIVQLYCYIFRAGKLKSVLEKPTI